MSASDVVEGRGLEPKGEEPQDQPYDPDQGEGFDDGGQQDAPGLQPDPDADRILQQFGEDPVALARAYAELNHKVGSLANEIGQLRVKAQLADQLLQQQQQAGQDQQEDPVENLAKRLREKAEAGEDIIPDLVEGIREIVRKELEPVQDQTKRVNAELLYERFVATHPDAENYLREMDAVHKEMPWLLPEGAGEAEFMKGLEAIYQLARTRAGRRRSGAPLDGRRGATRRGPISSPSVRQELNRRFNRAIQTASLDDWKDVVKGILSGGSR